MRSNNERRTRLLTGIASQLDGDRQIADNADVVESVETMLKHMRQASRRLGKKLNTPAKARAFLISAGIAVKSKSSPNGVRLAKRFR
jgi:hypothetical protein